MSERRYLAAIAATSLPWLIHSSVRAARLSAVGVAERAHASNSRSRAGSRFGSFTMRAAVLWAAARPTCIFLLHSRGTAIRRTARQPSSAGGRHLRARHLPLARICFGPVAIFGESPIVI